MSDFVNRNPDVLTALANLSSDEISTPPKLAKEVISLLPEELFTNPDSKFLDPVSKTGVFLREITKKLMVGLKEEIPNNKERINHILTKQVYGIAITELTSLISRRTLYCSQTANGQYSICDMFDDEQGNLIYENLEHQWESDKCSVCGIRQSIYDRDDDLEQYAYPFIHFNQHEDILKMRFDVIIGNPPYQLETGGGAYNKKASPIYHHFINTAKAMNPSYISMIIPARWMGGIRGLEDFKNDMLHDGKLKKIIDYENSKDVFSGPDIPGGICYFLWDKNYSGKCSLSSISNKKITESIRDLSEFDILIRFEEAYEIVKKVKSQTDEFMIDMVSSSTPFGLITSERPGDSGDYIMLSSAGKGPIESSRITRGHELIEKYKVITSKASHDHAGRPDKDGKRRVLSRLEVLYPGEVCTQSYVVVGAFESSAEAINQIKFLKTKFARFLISTLSFTQDIYKRVFGFVPMVNFYEEWSDEKLNKQFSLSKSEINFIDSKIKEIL